MELLDNKKDNKINKDWIQTPFKKDEILQHVARTSLDMLYHFEQEKIGDKIIRYEQNHTKNPFNMDEN